MVRPPDLDAEARAAGESFLQCFERSGAECRSETAGYRAWAAFQLLGFVRDGSPVAVLSRLTRALKSVEDDVAARRVFVAELTAAENPARDAVCQVVGVARLDEHGLDLLVSGALSRAERLGLARLGPGLDVSALGPLAAPMGDARVVEAACQRTAFRFFLVVVPFGGAMGAVSLRTSRPGAGGANRPAGRVTLPVPDDVVSPYIPVPEESL